MKHYSAIERNKLFGTYYIEDDTLKHSEKSQTHDVIMYDYKFIDTESD